MLTFGKKENGPLIHNLKFFVKTTIYGVNINFLLRGELETAGLMSM